MYPKDYFRDFHLEGKIKYVKEREEVSEHNLKDKNKKKEKINPG